MADAPEKYPIPGAKNLLLLGIVTLANCSLLVVASRSENAWSLLVCAVLFSFSANTMFALLHEAVHGIFHSISWVNNWAGRWAAAFFPTSFNLQKSYHLTHHRNNRTEHERFDYVQPGEVLWLKYAQWYSILTGFYWIVSVLGVLLYLLIPSGAIRHSRASAGSTVARQTAATAYLGALGNLPSWKIKLEIIFALLIQASMFILLDLTVTGWLVCYLAFGLNWSSLQYADHAFSKLSVRDGAWNLSVNPLFRALFLNYHLHLAHHRYPNVPWVYLPQLVNKDEPQPSFLKIWLSMWKGPRPLPEDTT